MLCVEVGGRKRFTELYQNPQMMLVLTGRFKLSFSLCHSFMVLGPFLSFSLLTCEMVLTQLLYPPFKIHYHL